MAVTARTVEAGDSRFEGSISDTVDQIREAGGAAAAVAADLARQEGALCTGDATSLTGRIADSAPSSRSSASPPGPIG